MEVLKMNNYHYPIDEHWTKDELMTVIALWNGVERAYESSINRTDFITLYKSFKQIVPGKADEKRLSREFEANSGYSLYKVVKEANSSSKINLSIRNERKHKS